MTDAKRLVAAFLAEVRSGEHPDRAEHFMAPVVRAHQVASEEDLTVERTPAQYAAHVRDMLEAYGPFTFRVDELIAEGDRVYARWTQRGAHLAEAAGHAATGKPLVEVASAVYRVADDRIAEYWIQIDRHGLAEQLRRNGG